MFDLEVNLGCIPAGGYTSDWWHQKGHAVRVASMHRESRTLPTVADTFKPF